MNGWGTKGWLVAVLTFWIIGSPSSAFAQPANATGFEQGNQAYRNGDFGQAAAAYAALVELGMESPQVYVNLGHAWFQLKQWGRATWAYEQALRLDPGAGDVEHALALVQHHRLEATRPSAPPPNTKRQEVDSFRTRPWPLWLAGRLNGVALAILAHLCWLGLFAALLIRRFGGDRGPAGGRYMKSLGRGWWLTGLAGMSLLAAGLLVFQLWVHGGAYGVVFEDVSALAQPEIGMGTDSAPVAGSPAGAANRGVEALHSGDYVRLGNSVEGWQQIRLEEGRSGWISRKHLGAISWDARPVPNPIDPKGPSSH